jgi:hypothetical protein
MSIVVGIGGDRAAAAGPMGTGAAAATTTYEMNRQARDRAAAEDAERDRAIDECIDNCRSTGYSYAQEIYKPRLVPYFGAYGNGTYGICFDRRSEQIVGYLAQDSPPPCCEPHTTELYMQPYAPCGRGSISKVPCDCE